MYIVFPHLLDMDEHTVATKSAEPPNRCCSFPMIFLTSRNHARHAHVANRLRHTHAYFCSVSKHANANQTRVPNPYHTKSLTHAQTQNETHTTRRRGHLPFTIAPSALGRVHRAQLAHGERAVVTVGAVVVIVVGMRTCRRRCDHRRHRHRRLCGHRCRCRHCYCRMRSSSPQTVSRRVHLAFLAVQPKI